jgi:hypothetical protein
MTNGATVLMMSAALFLGVATPAAAVTSLSTPISFTKADIGDGARLTFNTIIDGKTFGGLGAQMVIHLVGVNPAGTAWTFSLDRINPIVTLPKASMRVSSFGFNIFEDGKGSFSNASAKGDFASISFKQSPPQFKESFGICFAATDLKKDQACNGGGNGISTGNTGSGSFVLNFTQAVSTVRLDNFFARFQSIENVPDAEKGASGVGVAILMEPIPEPGTWAMMIAGFGLVGASLRRRRMLVA